MNKHKYFFRGMGIALIIISSIFYFINIINAKDVDNNKLNDDEIIIKAKELGMIYEEEINKKKEINEKIIKETLSDNEIIKRAKLLGMEFVEKDSTNKVDNKPVVEVKNSNEVENKEQPQISEDEESIKVKISYGMSSHDIANLLYEKGVVDDAKKLDKYILKNKYEGKLRTGNYIFNKNSTYEEIMKKITN
ncbi:MAG: hypothetical protein N4A50_00675 [Vallitalea sp.]|jgi:cell division protein YceG involved in septum cleavage|nr:hypothetical protein [Vallitalea sp.]